MKTADIVTYIRLVLYIPITLAALLDARFVVLVLFCLAQLTDFLDGRIARASGTASQEGALLDSRVDTIGFFFYLLWLWILFPFVYQEYWHFAIILFVLTRLALILGYYRFGQITGTHLWSAKIAAFAGALFLPLLIIFGAISWMVIGTAILGIIAMLEGIAFFALDKKNLDAKSIFE